MIFLIIITILLFIAGSIYLIYKEYKKNEAAKLLREMKELSEHIEDIEEPKLEEKDGKQILLKVDHLQQYFPFGKRELKAVDDVSFEIFKGEVFGLVGESGCGKTTTGRSIIRLYDITGGSVYFSGKRICAGIRGYVDEIKKARLNYKALSKELSQKLKNNEISMEVYKEELAKAKANLDVIVSENTEQIRSAKYDHKNCNKEYAKFEVKKLKYHYAKLISMESDSEKKIALLQELSEKLPIYKKERIMNKMQMIFQDPIASLDPRMTVRDIIAEGLIIRGIKDKEYIDKKVFEILETVGLVPEHASRYPHEFSGGQRQRIGIARAIILNPELIIADEPISALDVSIQAQVINLLNDLSEKMGLTTLFIAHDLAVVKYFSNRIAVMYFGKIVELTTSDELFKFPFHPYTKSLLSAIPVPDPYTEKNRTRVTYNPIRDHDYSEEGPTMREIYPGHFVLCNAKEAEEYKKQYSEGNK